MNPSPTTDATLDVVTIGRSSIDLYGAQIGGRLEDMASFRKAVGGSPANIAIGAARLGLRVGFCTRVGDEHMGRAIREQMVAEGVDPTGIITDPDRLSALVVLGVRDSEAFPHIFYRENCADMALCPDDIDPAFLARTRTVVVTGTHLSTETTAAACRKAIDIVRANGGRVVLDIDYRPNLWGLAGHAAGEERFVASNTVTEHLQSFLPLCDLVVGTEEEWFIAGGGTDTIAALRAARALTDATFVCKRGPMGGSIIPGDIPDDLDDAIAGRRFSIEVYNVLGAGDAFMGGFLRGWVRDEPWQTCATWANAAGAFAVSRLMCSPEYPSWRELTYFLDHGADQPALRHDAALTHVHRATNRTTTVNRLFALAVDHRVQFEALLDGDTVTPERISQFKQLAVAAAARVAEQHRDADATFGTLCDWGHGRQALYDASHAGLWIACPIEVPAARPAEDTLRFNVGRDLAGHILEWPAGHAVKCLCHYHPAAPAEFRSAQEAAVLQLHEACRAVDRELLLEIIASKLGPVDTTTTAQAMRRMYELGVKPDWWKLEPQRDPAAWAAIDAEIDAGDPYCRGVVVLGLEMPEADLADSFAAAADARHVRGFAIGRTVFMDPAKQWLAGDITDEQAVAAMADRFARLVNLWPGAAPPPEKRSS